MKANTLILGRYCKIDLSMSLWDFTRPLGTIAWRLGGFASVHRQRKTDKPGYANSNEDIVVG